MRTCLVLLLLLQAHTGLDLLGKVVCPACLCVHVGGVLWWGGDGGVR